MARARRLAGEAETQSRGSTAWTQATESGRAGKAREMPVRFRAL